MDNDLNTSKALAVIFDATTNANKAVAEKDKQTAEKYAAILLKLTDVMGFNIEKEKMSEEDLHSKLATIISDMDFLTEEDKTLTGYALMDKIIEYRNNARKEKNWAIADKVRNLFDSISIILKDTKEATIWEEK